MKGNNMFCTMSKEGRITISPEDEVDSYALNKWTKESDPGDIIVDTDHQEPIGFKPKE